MLRSCAASQPKSLKKAPSTGANCWSRVYCPYSCSDGMATAPSPKAPARPPEARVCQYEFS